MRYAIVSDIHANLQAWNAVLTDLTSLGADRIVCLGDVVGYGPDPAAVMESMYRHVDAFVMGNHDAVLCGKMSPELFNPRARSMIEWTADRVSRKASEFLARQSLVLTGPGFCCVHGDAAMPAAFRYIVEPRDARASWEATPDPLIFVGHTHVPGIFVLGASGVPHALPPQDFILEDGKRFVVNAGSVGFPRDRDARASYCIFDTDERAVRWRRVPFDLDALRAAMVRESTDPRVTVFVDADPRATRTPVREEAFFRPAANEAQIAHNVVTTRDLTTLRRRASRWRAIALVSVTAALLALGLTGALALRTRSFALTVPADPLPVQEAVLARDLQGNLVPPIPTAVINRRAGDWRYALSDRRVSSLVLRNTGEHAPAFVITNASRAACRIEAPAVALAGLADGKVQAQALVRRGDGFDGQVEVVVDLVDTDAQGRRRARPNLLRFAPARRRAGGWEQAQRTSDVALDARAQSLQLAIEGDFAGTLEIADITLTIAPREAR